MTTGTDYALPVRPRNKEQKKDTKANRPPVTFRFSLFSTVLKTLDYEPRQSNSSDFEISDEAST